MTSGVREVDGVAGKRDGERESGQKQAEQLFWREG